MTSEKPSDCIGPDWDAIKRDYSAGILSVDEISTIHGVGRSTIYYYVKTRSWPLRRASSRAGRRREKVNLTRRLLTALDMKMSQFEKRMNGGAASDSAADSERDARTLNTLVRLFEKLKNIDTSEAPAGTVKSVSKRQDDAALKDPHDADRIRGELARRLDKLRGQIGG